MPEVAIIARCFPTEEKEKVVHAIRSIFPDAEVSGEDPIVARTNSIEAFVEQLRRQRIRDSARAAIKRAMAKRSTTFAINKQVAFVGKISFSEETHALGDIEVTMSREVLEELVRSLSPDLRKEVDA